MTAYCYSEILIESFFHLAETEFRSFVAEKFSNTNISVVVLCMDDNAARAVMKSANRTWNMDQRAFVWLLYGDLETIKSNIGTHSLCFRAVM